MFRKELWMEFLKDQGLGTFLFNIFINECATENLRGIINIENNWNIHERANVLEGLRSLNGIVEGTGKTSFMFKLE